MIECFPKPMIKFDVLISIKDMINILIPKQFQPNKQYFTVFKPSIKETNDLYCYHLNAIIVVTFAYMFYTLNVTNIMEQK